jgi:hypothetical protein
VTNRVTEEHGCVTTSDLKRHNPLIYIVLMFWHAACFEVIVESRKVQGKADAVGNHCDVGAAG